MENLKGKVVVITGASGGIGAAAARKLVQLGAKVVLGARRENELKTLCNELGENAVYVLTDVTRQADLENLVQKAIATFGKV